MEGPLHRAKMILVSPIIELISSCISLNSFLIWLCSLRKLKAKTKVSGKSVPYSQYLCVISRHSKESTRDKSMRELTRGFMEAGYKENELDTQRNKALNSSTTSEDPNTTYSQPDTLVFAFNFLKEYNQIRKLFKEIQPDINSIIGDTRIIFALRKGPSIGNLLIHNRQVCTSVDKVNARKDQRCLMARCMMCGLMNRNETATTNGTSVKLAQNVNCKTENVIYFT